MTAPNIILAEQIPYKKIVVSATQTSIIDSVADQYRTSFFLDGNSIADLPPQARVILPDGKAVRPTGGGAKLEPEVSSEVRASALKLADAVMAVASIVSTLEVVGKKPSPSIIADAVFGILGDSASLLFMATTGAPLSSLALVGIMMATKGAWLIASIPEALEKQGQAEVVAVSRRVGEVLGFADPKIYGLRSVDQRDHLTTRRLYLSLYRDVKRLDKKVKALEFSVDEIRKVLVKHGELITPQLSSIALPSPVKLQGPLKAKESRLSGPKPLSLPSKEAVQPIGFTSKAEPPQRAEGVKLPQKEGIGQPIESLPAISQLILPVALSVPSALTLSPPIQKVIEKQAEEPAEENLTCCDELVSDASRSVKFGKPVDVPWARPMIGFPSIPVLGLIGLASFGFLLLARAVDRLEKLLPFVL